MKARPDMDPNLAFQNDMIALVRAFGLHKPDQTPCGQPVSVGEAHALMEIAREPGITQNGLAMRLQLEKSTISRIAALLENRKWIARTRDAADTRYVRMTLTATGRKSNATIAAARAAKFAKIFEALPKGKRSQVVASISMLIEALREE